MSSTQPTTTTTTTSNAACKRLMQEIQLCEAESDDTFRAAPLEDDLFEWHFSIRGAPDSDFAGGIYHGRILFPSDYPFKPPNIVLLTPNGRWEIGVKICLNASGYHPEEWKPSWSVKTLLVALISFMTTPGEGAVGAIELSSQQRRQLAIQSKTWSCKKCGINHSNYLPPIPQLLSSSSSSNPNPTKTTDSPNVDQQKQQSPDVNVETTNQQQQQQQKLSPQQLLAAMRERRKSTTTTTTTTNTNTNNTTEPTNTETTENHNNQQPNNMRNLRENQIDQILDKLIKSTILLIALLLLRHFLL